MRSRAQNPSILVLGGGVHDKRSITNGIYYWAIIIMGLLWALSTDQSLTVLSPRADPASLWCRAVSLST